MATYVEVGRTKNKINTIPREKYKILNSIFLLYFPDQYPKLSVPKTLNKPIKDKIAKAVHASKPRS